MTTLTRQVDDVAATALLAALLTVTPRQPEPMRSCETAQPAQFIVKVDGATARSTDSPPRTGSPSTTRC